MRRQNGEITPGPCPIDTSEPMCPPSAEINCIDVDKVYGFCIQSDFRFECFDIPTACGTPPFPAGTAIECDLGTINCTEIPPRLPATGFPTGFFNVTVQVNVPVTITVRNPDGTVRCTFNRTVRFLKPVLLFAPPGTRIDCRIVASDCREPRIIDDPRICVKIELCIIIQAVALVKLLVPAFGFCTPVECIPAAQEEFPCPPDNLFPPQAQPTFVAHIEWGPVDTCTPNPGASGLAPTESVQEFTPPMKKVLMHKGNSLDADVDLYMKLPDGQIVFFANPSVIFPSGRAFLVQDRTTNPGPEDIVVENPLNGTYCVCANLFSLGGDSPPIQVTATYIYTNAQGAQQIFGPFVGCLNSSGQFANFPSFQLPSATTGTPCSCT